MLDIIMIIISALTLSVLISAWRFERSGVDPIISVGTLRFVLIYLVVLDVATYAAKLL